MSHDHIMAKLTEILRDVLEDPNLVAEPETSAETVPGWDSMKQILILMAVQETFRIKLTTREIDRLRNVGDLAAAIGRHAGKQDAP
jgi:acyl carrier protein